MEWFSIGSLPARANKVETREVKRLYLKPGDSKTIIFLDDVKSEKQLFGYYEHNPVINQEYFHYFTCSTDNCYLCEKGNVAYAVKVLTVLEQYNDIWFRVLFPMKRALVDGKVVFPVWNKLERVITSRNLPSLRLAKFVVFRDSQKEAAIGSVFDYVGPANDIAPSLSPDILKPFVYQEVLQPKSKEYFIQLEKEVNIVYQEKLRKNTPQPKQEVKTNTVFYTNPKDNQVSY